MSEGGRRHPLPAGPACPRAAAWTSLALLLAAACSKPIPVGVVASRSGAAASYGERVVKGIDLALEGLSRSGGPGARFRLVYRDDATNPDVGEQVARELIDRDGVRLIVGAVSSPVTLRIAPVAEASRVLLLSPTASDPAITRAGDWVFRNYPSDVLEGASMADFARDAGLDRVAVIAVDHEFGAGLASVFAERFERDGRHVVRSLRFREGDQPAFSGLASELATLRLDGIYLVAYGGDVSAMLRALRAAGIAAPVLATSSVTDDTIRGSGRAAERLVFPRPAFDPASDEKATRAFVEAYRRKYHEEPDSFAAHGYDALRLLAAAIERGGSADPEDVRRGLHAIENWSGASGPVAFDENGDVVQYPRLFIVERGRSGPYDRFVERGGTLAPAERE